MNHSWGNLSTGIGFADQVFELGVAQGQTFVSSTGDNGAYPCFNTPDMLPNGPLQGVNSNGVRYGSLQHPSTEYPASSPYVVAVGGTTLSLNSSGGYGSESAWAFSGGGISSSEPAPFWQSNLDNSYRQTPDLALDADPNSDMQVYDAAGKKYSYAGTSLASPLFAGMWARLQSAHNNQLGFAAPMIYELATLQNTPLGQAMNTQFSGILHDVKTGTNRLLRSAAPHTVR